jgi:DNA primase
LLFLATYISEDKLLEIRHAADIVDIVSESVILKRAGKNLIGLCPFHGEKTPSFTVSPDKQIFYCFGCGTGGNVFSYVMKRDGIPFAEAARDLARRYGIEIPEKPLSPMARKSADEKARLFQINRQALEFFRLTLMRQPAGRRALDYLQRRGIKPATIESFQLGYAPTGWDGLSTHMAQKGVAGTWMEKAGLVVPRKDGKGFYDRFRDRVMFPIFDDGSQVVGFGGRVMDDSTPKYLNSPETSIYSKRRVLYGLHRAKDRCRAAGSVYIVEGYLDLIALHQNGIENSVATLGTALTPEHLRLLTRFAGRMVLVYDSDAAGIRSAHRCVEIFWKEHVDFRRGDVYREDQADTHILVLPEGHDPDSFLNQFGAEAFKLSADRAPGIITFLMESSVARHGLSTEGKIRVVSDLVAPLAAINDSVAQALYVKQLSERVGLPELTIRQRLKQPAAAGDASRSWTLQAPSGPPRHTPETHERFEQRILAMMLQFPNIIPEIRSRSILDYFESPLLKRIGESIVSYGYKSGDQLPEFMRGVEDEDARAILPSLVLSDESWNLRGSRALLNRFLSSRQKEADAGGIQQQIEAAEKANDEAELTRLLKEKQRLAMHRGKQKISASRAK